VVAAFQWGQWGIITMDNNGLFIKHYLIRSENWIHRHQQWLKKNMITVWVFLHNHYRFWGPIDCNISRWMDGRCPELHYKYTGKWLDYSTRSCDALLVVYSYNTRKHLHISRNSTSMPINAHHMPKLHQELATHDTLKNVLAE
jgi:hypothetical protein